MPKHFYKLNLLKHLDNLNLNPYKILYMLPYGLVYLMDIESQRFSKRTNNSYLNFVYNIGIKTNKLPFIRRR
jgi:hypothetical protein